MTGTLLTLTLAAALAAGPSADKPREPSPYAPSLPELTDEEEAHLDEVIHRFIQQDIGQLAGAEGTKARREFDRLGPEAIPALIRGLNEAAKIDHSCPAVVIARKLYRMLMASQDTELLQFARENVGAGITASRHMDVLRDLRLACTLRKNQLLRLGITGPAAPTGFSTEDLVRSAGSATGPRQKQVLKELARRPGDEPIRALGEAAGSDDSAVRDLARDLLVSNLGRQTLRAVKAKLKDKNGEVRAAAVRVVGTRFRTLGGDLIDLLIDDDLHVREVAHQTLVRLNAGKDLGSVSLGGSDADRDEVVAKWRAWWDKRGGR
jgi:hypothetical protein